MPMDLLTALSQVRGDSNNEIHLHLILWSYSFRFT